MTSASVPDAIACVGHKTNRELDKSLFNDFPPGAIRPSGWLKDQLQLCADGLGGHMFDFYRYVQRSQWLGGDCEYSPLNEASPYWFNYIVPLAWTLDDQRLKDQARAYLNHTLDHQADDGWLGPETTRQTRGLWARALLFFGLTQYAEADPTQEKRIVDAMHKFVALAHSMLQDNFTGLLPDKSQGDMFDAGLFGAARSHELPISLMWLYEKHPRDNGTLVIETIELMFEGGRQAGLDWSNFFVDGVFPETGGGSTATSGFTHGVNLAQGLRYPTVLQRLTRDQSLKKRTRDAVELTTTYQSSLSGSIVGDEHLGGQSPQRGSELCMAVESIFSYAYLYRFHGDNEYADRAELAAFNALPAGISPDWWARQYVTQTNQPWARKLDGDNPFSDVNLYGVTYGLEIDYPCCTVNHPAGYPKYVTSSYVRDSDLGIAHVLLGPTSLETTIDGKSVKITCDTQYPFGSVLKYIIQAETAFSFSIRVPQWTTSQATVQLDAADTQKLIRDKQGLHSLLLQAGTHTVLVRLPMQIKVVHRNDSVAIYYGPLLFSADIAYNETFRKATAWQDGNPLPDSERHPKALDHFLEPTSPWQFAIDPDSIAVEENGDDESDEPLRNPIFARGAPPVSLSVNAYPIEWPVDHGSASLPPVNPVADASSRRKLKLVPFGSAKVHIAQFPVANIR